VTDMVTRTQDRSRILHQLLKNPHIARKGHQGVVRGLSGRGGGAEILDPARDIQQRGLRQKTPGEPGIPQAGERLERRTRYTVSVRPLGKKN
jgi:hypothetical protein